MKKIGSILSWTVTGIAIAIVILIAVLFALDGDGDISKLTWTEEMIEEYEKYPEEFRVEYIKAYEDERTFTEDGYFSVSKSRYIPALSQWQFTIRYNHSTLRYLSEERGEEMAVEDDHFTFALVDDKGNVYRDFEYKKETKGRYTYYRLVFDSVNIKKVDDIQIMIYCIADIEGEELPKIAVGKLPLYYSVFERKDYKFKKELPEDMKPTEGFTSGDELLKGKTK
ncbi:MAG: hypothetical protein IKT46_01395 [Clostridia bacterium]|nr:hypothetical protein [Clostridia bacterium]